MNTVLYVGGLTYSFKIPSTFLFFDIFTNGSGPVFWDRKIILDFRIIAAKLKLDTLCPESSHHLSVLQSHTMLSVPFFLQRSVPLRQGLHLEGTQA